VDSQLQPVGTQWALMVDSRLVQGLADNQNLRGDSLQHPGLVGSLQGPELVGNLQDPGLVDSHQGLGLVGSLGLVQHQGPVDSLQEQGDSRAGLVGSQVLQDIRDIHQVAAAEVDTGKKNTEND